MAVRAHLAHLPTPRRWLRPGDAQTIALALALFAVVYVLQAEDARPADALEVLYVAPIALLALRFGLRGGLAGQAIPLVGRIVAVADVFDALTHDRPYKSAWPHERALAEIRAGAGSQFDPDVVAAFLSTHERYTNAPSSSRRPPSGSASAMRTGVSGLRIAVW